MRVALGLIATGLLGLLVAGQLLSVIDFPLAQRLGLQEPAAETDPLVRQLELRAAAWDQLSLWWLPIAGVLMLLDQSWWPQMTLVGGAAYVDAGGREAAKYLGLRAEGVRVGSRTSQRVALGAYALLLAIGLWAVAYGLVTLA